ncbi:sensor histidine kinase [Actinacidiphila bryophytorum]|uniref:histidine kinase n=1 Tax=Actinacidiphila bryophytorum TaxID=1436133 RepID=A0A9W4MHG5_9ACTN|nr:HAMP domain-containing sensor histidine kinase [Actinacidiphila bryophytorum]MBM9435205.1 HAMP domain-containing histidine kinase [Actinacidiphila bryophytorum]MBN6541586.1 HAMP domain-containing histidine kinase [Actinacidiphila bryophytorum]CAG7643713.1 Histidine kinase [Actinacidiphila bryophytorum]
MTRRIALAVMALVTVLLVLAVVPLGLSLAGRERTTFRDNAEAADRVLAASAEEHLSDQGSTASLRQLLERATEQDDCAAVFDTAGRVVAATACPGQDAAQSAATREEWAALAREAIARPATLTRKVGDRLSVAVTVGDATEPVGVSVLSRSVEPTDDRIATMWARLAAVGIGGLVAGALLAVGLARWVGRPLRAVDLAARDLGEGRLGVRAAAGRGPVEVRRLSATFNTMAARMETLIHGHQAVIADVSHQLRTPLTALRLRLDMLAVDADEPTAAELASAQEEIARLSRLVDGLLAVARAENAVPRPVAVRVDEVVADRVAAWSPVARERRVVLSGRCPQRLAARLGAGDLEQVLDNLVANALDAVDEGGRVRIDGRTRRGRVVLTVTDDGPGMTPEARAAAFHRFGNPEASGAGLGLAIVYRLLTANGGSVRFADTPGGGLTVVMELDAAGT